MNVAIRGNLATITFRHVRPDPTPMFKDGTLRATAVVAARVVITVPNLIALRDLLNHHRASAGPTSLVACPEP
jgi:hypothetical protein